MFCSPFFTVFSPSVVVPGLLEGTRTAERRGECGGLWGAAFELGAWGLDPKKGRRVHSN